MATEIEMDMKRGIVDLLGSEGKDFDEEYERIEKGLKEDYEDAKKENKDVDVADFVSEWADDKVPAYDDDVSKWYVKDSNRYDYVNDAMEEFGDDEKDETKRLSVGIYYFLEQWANEVLGDEE